MFISPNDLKVLNKIKGTFTLKRLKKGLKEWKTQKYDKIIVEIEALDTYQKISGIMDLISEDSDPEITVVTHWQHAFRFKIIFWRMYGLKVRLIKMFYWVSCFVFVFEWAFLFLYLFDKKRNSWLVKKNREQRSQK